MTDNERLIDEIERCHHEVADLQSQLNSKSTNLNTLGAKYDDLHNQHADLLEEQIQERCDDE